MYFKRARLWSHKAVSATDHKAVSAILTRIGLWSPCAVSGAARLWSRKAVSAIPTRIGLWSPYAVSGAFKFRSGCGHVGLFPRFCPQDWSVVLYAVSALVLLWVIPGTLPVVCGHIVRFRNPEQYRSVVTLRCFRDRPEEG